MADTAAAAAAPPAKMEGAVPKKVYMHYDESADAVLHLTLKMTLPSKWASHTVDYLKEFFVEHYNTKKPEDKLDGAQFHLERKNVALHGDELLHYAVQKHDDLFLKSGPSTKKPVKTEAKKVSASAQNLLQCKNFGCAKKFSEEENHDAACHHHAQPPTFHDMKKGWTCCSSKMVYDWDDFEKIAPCQVGRHSTAPPNAQFAKSPTVLAAEGAEAAAAAAGGAVPAAAPSTPVLKSIDDYNKKNPNAVTAVSAAVETQTATAPVRTDGKARCVNYGCQKEYVVAENPADACSHHTGPPVFHDAGKFWSCCPKNVKYDFESFLQVPGCAKSSHRDTKA
ncbi:Chord family protein [Globisporangium polare]